MPEHYTDEDVKAAYDAWDGQPAIPGNHDSIRAVLDAAAPAIAARARADALREAADEVCTWTQEAARQHREHWLGQAFVDGQDMAYERCADWLRDRADEIEGTR